MELHNCLAISNYALRQTIPTLQLLQKLTISLYQPFDTTIEVIGQACPLLSSFEVTVHSSIINIRTGINYHAMAIGMSMHGLRTLKICSSHKLTNVGIEHILLGCPHLHLLDIQHCEALDLVANMRDRCQTQIQQVLWPEGYLQNAEDGFLDDMDDLHHYG